MPHEHNPIDVFPETAEFWKAASENRLLIKRCTSCGQSHFYPRPTCPFCRSERTEWLETTGRGTIYSFSVPRRARPPRAVAIIEINGVRLTSVIVDADLSTLDIGQEVVFHPLPGNPCPEIAFTPVQSRIALDHAERVIAAAPLLPGLPAAEGTEFERAAIIGAGTMGVGITQAFLNVGIPVLLLDRDEASLQRGLERIRDQYERAVKSKRLDAAKLEERMAMILTSTDMSLMAQADVVVEAVWEQLGLKREVFGTIDKYARPGVLLGTNTSALDVNEIASATLRPQDVLGLHFFTPAQSMKLLEIVRGRLTSPASVSRAVALGLKLRKTAVVVEVAPGFVGNRMFGAREKEARTILLEGATPEQVDRILTQFGMPMGTFEIADMTSGVELGYRRRQETGAVDPLGDAMFLAGRVGQKAGKGFYKYQQGGRKPEPDLEVLELLERIAYESGINRRQLTDAEIEERLVLTLINEGMKLLDEGVTKRPGDIDAVWLHGYGWPAWRGGPMYYADQLGAAHIFSRLTHLEHAVGERFRPAELLRRLAGDGGSVYDVLGS